jgi:CheY-like chemotaxis protein
MEPNLIVVCDMETINEFQFGLSNYDQSKVTYLYTKEQWIQFETKFQHQHDDIFLVLAELSWNPTSSLSTFQGMEVLRWMRMEQRWLNPVFICSFIEKEMLIESNNPCANLFAVLRVSSSHQFLLLPFTEPLDATSHVLSPLTKLQLYDLVDHFYKQKGILDEILHRLKDRIIKNPIPAVDEALKALELIIDNEKRIDLFAIMSNLKKDTHSNSTLDKVMGHVRRAKDELLKLIPESFEDEIYQAEDVDWLTLCVDDNESIRNELRQQLNKRKLPCICVGTAEEAFEVLKQDAKGELVRPVDTTTDEILFYPANQIHVLVTDLRFEDQNQYWHKYQGYDIIEKLHENNDNTLAFFLLTSKSSSQRHEYSKTRAHVDWCLKEEVFMQDGFNDFVKRIERAGNEIDEILLNVPKSSAWTKKGEGSNYSLHDYYLYHRKSANYAQEELRINEEAYKFIIAVNNQRDSSRIEDKSLNCPFKFYSKLKNPPSDQHEMKKFYEKLIGRRIVLGMQIYDFGTSEISDALKNIADKESDTNKADNKRQIISSPLALSIRKQDNTSANLLLEERLFLEKYLGCSMDNSTHIFFQKLRKQFSKFLVDLAYDMKESKEASKLESIKEELDCVGTTGKAKQIIQKIIDLIDKMPKKSFHNQVRKKFKEGLEALAQKKDLAIPKDLDLQVFISQLNNY